MQQVQDKKEQKNIMFRADAELHKKIKIYTAEHGISIQDYMMSLVLQDLESDKIA